MTMDLFPEHCAQADGSRVEPSADSAVVLRGFAAAAAGFPGFDPGACRVNLTFRRASA